MTRRNASACVPYDPVSTNSTCSLTTVDLALHGWTEPIERVVVAAKAAGVTVVMPPPGGSVEPGSSGDVTPWWPDLPWETVGEAPVQSSEIGHLMSDGFDGR